jgi:hypothetical protein
VTAQVGGKEAQDGEGDESADERAEDGDDHAPMLPKGHEPGTPPVLALESSSWPRDQRRELTSVEAIGLA